MRAAQIEKIRYHVPVGAHTWEVDVFAGDNEGLIVAEVELADEEESFEQPYGLAGKSPTIRVITMSASPDILIKTGS